MVEARIEMLEQRKLRIKEIIRRLESQVRTIEDANRRDEKIIENKILEREHNIRVLKAIKQRDKDKAEHRIREIRRQKEAWEKALRA